MQKRIIQSIVIILGLVLIAVVVKDAFQTAKDSNLTATTDEQMTIPFPSGLTPMMLAENAVLIKEPRSVDDNTSEPQPTELLEQHYVAFDFLESQIEGITEWSYEQHDKRYTLRVGDRTFQYIDGMNVGREGNRFFPFRGGIIEHEQSEDRILVASDFLHYGLGYIMRTVTYNDGTKYLFVDGQEDFGVEQNQPETELPVRQWDLEKRYQQLKELDNPLPGSHVSTQASQWPGAPRPYRNGIHEGLDFYSYTSGVVITKNTAVRAMGDGIVLRADHDYREMDGNYRDNILRIAKEQAITPEYILDEVRGRSVWIQHANGIVARYIHLNTIDPEIKVGQPVAGGQIIGNVGNSGTSQGVDGSNEGVHLHLDILIYGQLFWEGLSSQEGAAILRRVLNE